MDKYISISKIVTRVTDDDLLRAFFTVYLFEDDEEKRDILDKEFWAELDMLPELEKVEMRKKLVACFKQLPLAVADWGKDVEAFIATQQLKKAA